MKPVLEYNVKTIAYSWMFWDNGYFFPFLFSRSISTSCLRTSGQPPLLRASRPLMWTACTRLTRKSTTSSKGRRTINSSPSTERKVSSQYDRWLKITSKVKGCFPYDMQVKPLWNHWHLWGLNVYVFCEYRYPLPMNVNPQQLMRLDYLFFIKGNL